MATGKPRFKNLGKISDGCRFSLMSGDILDQPLPTTRVANLRLNHLQFLITFIQPCKFRNEEQENSTIFRVGNKNELYGNEKRKKTRDEFIKKKKEKSVLPGDLLNNMLKAMIIQDERNREEGGDQQQQGDPSQHQSSAQVRFGKSRDYDRNGSTARTSSSHPQFQPKYTSSPAMEEAKELARLHVAPPTLETDQETGEDTDEGEHHHPGATGWTDDCVTPEGSDADKVSIPPTPTSPMSTTIPQTLSNIKKDTCTRSGKIYTFGPHQKADIIDAKRKSLKKENDRLSKEHFAGNGSKSA